jgi:hypothetical protein
MEPSWDILVLIESCGRMNRSNVPQPDLRQGHPSAVDRRGNDPPNARPKGRNDKAEIAKQASQKPGKIRHVKLSHLAPIAYFQPAGYVD